MGEFGPWFKANWEFLGSHAAEERCFSAWERLVQYLPPSWVFDPSGGGRGQRGHELDCPLPACGIKCSTGRSIGQRRNSCLSQPIGTQHLESLAGPSPPHLGSPRTRNIIGVRGVFTGPKASIFTHPSAQRMGRFRSLSGPELLGPRIRTGEIQANW